MLVEILDPDPRYVEAGPPPSFPFVLIYSIYSICLAILFHFRFQNFLSNIKSSPLGTVYQRGIDSSCYFTGLGTNEWDTCFLSKLEPSEEIKTILSCSIADLTEETSSDATTSQLPYALFNIFFPGSVTRKVSLISTSFGRVFISLADDEAERNGSKMVILAPLTNQSIIWMSVLSISSSVVGIILVGSGGTVVVMTETGGFLRSRKFQLGLAIVSACVVNGHIVFVSDGSILAARLTRTGSLILMAHPEKQVPTRLALSLAYVPGSAHVLVYCSDQVIFSLDFGLEELRSRPKEAAGLISSTLNLLEGVSKQQDTLQGHEQHLDDIIMNINAAIHAGTIKSQFGLKITPKIDSNRTMLSISLSIPPFLISLCHWSITLSIVQSTWHWSQSIPLMEFQIQNKSNPSASSTTLSYRFPLPLHSLHPITIRAFTCFHQSELDFELPINSKSMCTPFLTSTMDPRLAVFPIGEHIFDALDLMVRTKRVSSRSDKPTKLPFQMRLSRSLLCDPQTPLQLPDTSPYTMDLNFSTWSFTDWLDWKEIPESLMVGLFGNALISNSAISPITDSKSSGTPTHQGIHIPMEAITGTLVNLHLRPLSGSDRALAGQGSSSLSKSLSTKDLVCIVSIQSASTEQQQIRAALLSRIRSLVLSGPPESCNTDEILSIKAFSRGIQPSWRSITSLESTLSQLKYMRSQLQHPNSSLSREELVMDVTVPVSFHQALEKSAKMVSDVAAVYRQLRLLIGDKFGI